MTRLDDMPELLTVSEAREFLRVGRATIYDLARRGEIRTVRIGRRVFIPRDVVRRLIGGGAPGA